MRESVEIVVVGAGVGGLAAGRALIAAGREVVILEARSRVGGRLLSMPAGEAGIDLGATWFWANEPRVRALASELGLAVHAQYILGDALYEDARGVHRLEGNPIEGPARRLSAGMQELARALERALPEETVLLQHRVDRIGAFEERLEVGCTGRVVRCEHVVLAVPPALAARQIGFDPGLPADLLRIASMTPVWMGSMTKVVVRYERTFWRESGLAGAVVSHVGPMREVHDMSGPGGLPAALFGFVPPTAPGAPTVKEDEVRTQLSRLFGPGAPEPSEILILDWRGEPDTSPTGVESLQAYETYGHPLYRRPALGGRLHWASTETATEVPGHVEGAIVAGERAAAAILGTAGGVA